MNDHRARTRFAGRPWLLLIPLAGGLTLLVCASPALAGSAWTGTGSVNFSSTPSSYGSCDGSGSSSLDLSGDASSLSGTLMLDLQSVSSACAGSFTMGPVSDPVTGYASNGYLYLTDSYGDSISGPLNGGSLTLSFTTTSTSGGGAMCVEFCTTTYTIPLSGTGDLSVGGFGLGSIGATQMIAGVGIVGGVAALGAVAASAAPLGGAAAPPPVPPADSGFPWVSFSDHFGSLAQVPPGSIRQDAPAPGHHLSKPPNGGRCRCCGAPLFYTVAGWFCPNPACLGRCCASGAPQSLFPAPGQPYGAPPLQPPRV
ncbi:MAG: hypothetical protein ACHQ2Y_04760 [Candidatus Lutacidiplasmatales archaeon]